MHLKSDLINKLKGIHRVVGKVALNCGARLGVQRVMARALTFGRLPQSNIVLWVAETIKELHVLRLVKNMKAAHHFTCPDLATVKIASSISSINVTSTLASASLFCPNRPPAPKHT